MINGEHIPATACRGTAGPVMAVTQVRTASRLRATDAPMLKYALDCVKLLKSAPTAAPRWWSRRRSMRSRQPGQRRCLEDYGPRPATSRSRGEHVWWHRAEEVERGTDQKCPVGY